MTYYVQKTFIERINGIESVEMISLWLQELSRAERHYTWVDVFSERTSFPTREEAEDWQLIIHGPSMVVSNSHEKGKK